MLCLAFRLEEERYALDVGQIVEVLPLVQIRRVSHAANGVAGVILYRGTAMPVVDLSQLLVGRPSHRRLSTRIVVVRRTRASADIEMIGLIAEGATETLRVDAQSSTAMTDKRAQTNALGPIRVDRHGLIQQLDLEALLPRGLGFDSTLPITPP